MNLNRRNKGFSLTEILMAFGIMVVGMLFVAGVFPVSIYLSTKASEQTVASTVADEAFAKIRLIANEPNCMIYASDFNVNGNYLFELTVNNKRFQNWLNAVTTDTFFRLADDEFAYPSINPKFTPGKQYCWTAICRRLNLNDKQVQVTVFVSKKAGNDATYWDPNKIVLGFIKDEYVRQPKAIRVEVSNSGSNRSDELSINKLTINDDMLDEKVLINDGSIIVDDATGQIYRVLERYSSTNDRIILLDREWSGRPLGWNGYIWVVPPPINGGKNVGVAVYQKVMEF